jgi:hypothetical protein
MLQSGNVYVMGGSHTSLYEKQFNRVVVGSITLHRYGRDGIIDTVTQIVKDFRIPQPGDILLIVAGEVDCRCHIYKQVYEINRDEDEVITELAERFTNRMIAFRNLTGVDVGVRGIVPPLSVTLHYDPNYPMKGDLEDRKRWRLKLNKKLKELCEEYKFLFVPSPPWVENPDHTMKLYMSDGTVHIHDRYAESVCADLLEAIEQFYY